MPLPHFLQICEEDVEWHTFEEISTETAVCVAEALRSSAGPLVQEMQRFIAAFEAVRAGTGHDLDSFWLRKTRKPVLAVLQVARVGEEPRFYRGTNMEVSMPTGSLCAERNGEH